MRSTSTRHQQSLSRLQLPVIHTYRLSPPDRQQLVDRSPPPPEDLVSTTPQIVTFPVLRSWKRRPHVDPELLPNTRTITIPEFLCGIYVNPSPANPKSTIPSSIKFPSPTSTATVASLVIISDPITAFIYENGLYCILPLLDIVIVIFVTGYYADLEARCQVFHVCSKLPDDHYIKSSFLCPNGTIFNQENFACQWSVFSGTPLLFNCDWVMYDKLFNPPAPIQKSHNSVLFQWIPSLINTKCWGEKIIDNWFRVGTRYWFSYIWMETFHWNSGGLMSTALPTKVFTIWTPESASSPRNPTRLSSIHVPCNIMVVTM